MPILAPLVAAVALQAGAPAAPARVEVAPVNPEVAVGEAVSMTVEAFDSTGAQLEGATIRWLAVTPEIVAISGEGELRGVRPGDGRIAVVVSGATTFVDVRVPALPVAEVQAALAGPVLVGLATPLESRALNRLGDPVGGSRVRLTSADPAVARVDAFGRIVGVTQGQTRIVAEAGGVSREVPVTVGPAPAGALRVEPAESSVRTGDVVRLSIRSDTDPDATVFAAWSVSGAGAQVEAEDAEGVFVAEVPGTYRVTAELGPERVRHAVVEVAQRQTAARVEVVGHGGISTHHSGDTWVFEGADGRDYAYVGTFMHDWMKVFDVTDPASPTLVDSMQLDARRINDVKIHPNNRIGILTREGAASRRNGIVLLDLSEPAHPSIISEYTETVSGGVHNVWVRGELDLIYACHNGTGDIHIIDISDPTAPVEVGRWGLDKPFKTLHDVIVQDGYAYASYWDDGVVVLDVGAGTHGGTPTEPAFVSSFSYPQGNTHVAWRSGRYLFVGDEIFPEGWDPEKPIEARGYIHVLDVEDIDNPREVARYEVPEAGAHNVWVEDDRLYVGYYQAGLRVVDVSGELRGDLYRQGREIGYVIPIDGESTVPNWPMTWGAQVFKGNVFTSDLNSGLWVAKVVDERPVS